ncbi:YozE family protein [Massilia aquatica]|nr:YozE family protein [Massilia aquatica]
MSTRTPAQITSAQIEQLKRAAKKLTRTSTFTHADALDHLALENGFKNWSLLAKYSKRSTAAPPVPPVPAPPAAATKLSRSRRRHLHGDQAEDDTTKFYCAQCDLFTEAGHFRSQHTWDESLQRALDSLNRWERRPSSETMPQRPKDAVNMLEQPARAAAAAAEAARGPFHRWLEQQKGKDTIVGDIASDVISDKKFPVGATTYAEVQDYLEHFASSAAMEGLKEAWKKFQASVKRAEKRTAGSV